MYVNTVVSGAHLLIKATYARACSVDVALQILALNHLHLSILSSSNVITSFTFHSHSPVEYGVKTVRRGDHDVKLCVSSHKNNTSVTTLISEFWEGEGGKDKEFLRRAKMPP